MQQHPMIVDVPPGTHVQGLWVMFTLMGAVLLIAMMVGFVIGWWWRGRSRSAETAPGRPTAT
jgi:hypothetical protein